MITVLHANESILRESFALGYGTTMEQLISHYIDGNYDIAGEIDTDDLNVAFAKSQNVNGPWGDEGQRSTSVGDMLKNRNGDIWLVDVTGMLQIRKGA